MSLSPKMLPCKKRRTNAADSSAGETGLSSDALPLPMETSPSGAGDDVKDEDKATFAEEKHPHSPLAGRPVCQSIPAVSTDAGEPETIGGETSAAGLCRDAAQKGWRGSVEASCRGGKKTLPKATSELCPQQADLPPADKTPPVPELLADKERKMNCEAGSLCPRLGPEWEAGDGPPHAKAPKTTPSTELPPEAEEEAEETGLFIPVEEQECGGKRRRRKATKRRREGRGQEEGEGPLACDLKLDDTLDRTLEDGAKQHNLTAVNVRNILHEVITNEHVVAMMKAAISETEGIPMFEPKMTRSKLKEVVEKGVPPQFVDIPLEEDDSSDEEYQPEEEEEDETAEESLMESDVESSASSPHRAKRSRARRSSDVLEAEEEGGAPAEAEKASATPPLQRHISAEVVPMGPPPPPKPKQSKDSSFMEKLHAVDEELASSPICMDSYQPLEDSLIALRTRSKRPLKDVPLGQLEAELRAPDITPDMYDPNTADDEEWKRWLGGLMNDDVENEGTVVVRGGRGRWDCDEADDDDDPEYNFLEDLDEPDTEDFRNDRAVRITKKEVTELMEELFETFQDEMGFSNVEDEGPEDEDSAAEARPNFNTPQVLRFEEPLANLLNEQHRTVKEQLEQLRMKKTAAKLPQEAERARLRSEKPVQVLTLDVGERKRLQQQMQQHVQLLTQIHLLSSSNPGLNSEASTARLFLKELATFAESSALVHGPKFQTVFRPCNLEEALQLIEDFHAHVKIEWSPRKAAKKNVSDFPSLPKQVAWILATRRVFMYPELLPTCSLKAKTPRDKVVFTKGEDNLLALGLKHFEGTEFPKPLISKYLLTTKTAQQLTVRIKNLNMNRVPDNILKYYKKTKQVPVLSRVCEDLQPGEWKPPLEQEEHHLPYWLKASLPSLRAQLEQAAVGTPAPGKGKDEPAEPPSHEKYPLRVPEGLQWNLRPLASRFCRKAWRRQRSAAAKPLPVRPGLCLQPASAGGYLKMAARQPQPEVPPSKAGARVPRLIQPAPPLQPLPRLQHLRLQPALGTGGSFELLPAPQPSPRPCLAAAVAPNLVSFQPQVVLPVLPTPKARKPSGPRAFQKKKGPKAAAAPLLKAAPLLHPAPVIFTVPAGAMKVVGIANGCNVLQPLAATAGRAAQPIPITTLLVNPGPFPCPLGQPLASPPASPLVVPTPAAPQDVEAAGQAVRRWSVGGEASCVPVAEPKAEAEEPPSCSVASPEGGRDPPQPDPERGVPLEASVPAPAEAAVEEREALLSAKAAFSPMPGLDEAVKVELGEPPDAPQEPEKPGPVGAPVKEELVLGLGQELDVEPAPERVKTERDVGSTRGAREAEAHGGSRLCPGGPAAGTEGSGSSPRHPSGAASCSPAAKSEEPPGLALGVPAGHEAAGEKEGQEEEEEEDFDDLTQDEEDEMSSEESVLSVPELQETMEKLTWLASERRLSQEGDSEEENSQEENSEPEEEEEEEDDGEGEGETLESLQKEDEMMDEVADPTERPASSLARTCAAPEVKPSRTPPGQSPKAPGKSRGAHRARAKRGRGRASKDTSKLLLLYDEDILERDPLREQKDLAFAQAYLSRVREALRHVPGRYEEFLRIIYEFESNAHKQTAADLCARLRSLLREWPQLLTDFAAFLLPEQALECGLFEEQQAFEKSRRFLRQLEICFAENPSHHQKIVKVLQGCAKCLPQEISELKTQMWQLLKGHDHLQDELSVFFDHLRPSASRLGDFEEVSWTEEKEYEFDGFEEVSLPEVEEEDDPPKIHPSLRNKKRKELGSQNTDKDAEWAEGAKECCCSCHEGSGDPRLKRSKRRSCSHCSSKVGVEGAWEELVREELVRLAAHAGDSRPYRTKDPQELSHSLAQREPSPRPEGKEPVEEGLEHRDDGEAPPSRARTTARRADAAGGSRAEGKWPLGKDVSSEGAAGRTAESCPLQGSHCPKKAPVGDGAKPPPASTSPTQTPKGLPPKLPRPKCGPCPGRGEGEAGLGPRGAEASSGLGRATAETACGAGRAGPPPPSGLAEELPAPDRPGLKDHEAEEPPATAGDLPARGPGPKPARGTDCAGPAKAPEARSPPGPAGDQAGKAPGGSAALPRAGQRGDEMPPRVAEATVCAKNIKVSSTGEKVVLWTREADRVILTTCQARGAHPDTFSAVSQQLRNKTAEEVAHRFRELMTLFHTACDGSSEDEDDATSTSNTDQLSDKDPGLSEEEEQEEHGC
ncbi:hypothetical protein lerEdw1_002997 [Lerista edwardsae]|nr:hypothetical protein lerEdw1_002997 [Lerista edwardsae]